MFFSHTANHKKSFDSKTTQVEQHSGELASERLTWKSFDGVVGDTAHCGESWRVGGDYGNTFQWVIIAISIHTASTST